MLRRVGTLRRASESVRIPSKAVRLLSDTTTSSPVSTSPEMGTFDDEGNYTPREIVSNTSVGIGGPEGRPVTRSRTLIW